MKDKRTYKYEKEHGEDMTHENESKIDPVIALTEPVSYTHLTLPTIYSV